MQHDEDGGRTIRALEHTVSEIRMTINNALKTMVQEQKIELVTVKDDIQRIRDTLNSHVAKEESRGGISPPRALRTVRAVE